MERIMIDSSQMHKGVEKKWEQISPGHIDKNVAH